jgi:2-keto-4-pentenoate hydratase/2-oxohepta-3-ene-1,7-dioic acid hydratase in catechol pathway
MCHCAKNEEANVDKIICVGKNYPDHAAELGDAQPNKPVLFLKPPSVLRHCSASGECLELTLPSHSSAVHHEVELVFRIGKGGFRMSIDDAQHALDAVTVGLDMTLRDLQTTAKKAGAPWTTGKVFPDAAVVGPWLDLANLNEIENQEFALFIDGALRQQSKANHMIFNPAECLAYASTFFPICEGDLLFTGTPVGVAPVSVNQTATLTFSTISYRVHWARQA